jgi:hypothetical protein
MYVLDKHAIVEFVHVSNTGKICQVSAADVKTVARITCVANVDELLRISGRVSSKYMLPHALGSSPTTECNFVRKLL